MFYQNIEKTTRASLVLTPLEAKKLIAKGVAACPLVKNTLKDGVIIIAGGTTNGFIARELTGLDIDVNRYTAGRISLGKLDTTPKDTRLLPIILQNGKSIDTSIPDALSKFTAKDLFIKGANAIDPQGRVGVLVASESGGTVGAFWALAASRGASILCPVGLEKLIPSVETAVFECGQGRFKYNMGHKVGLLPISGAYAFTEIQALEALYAVQAVHISSGGVLGSEGSIVLSVKGPEKNIDKMWEEVNCIKLC